MNEQDIMNKINAQTKDIPIPDSISPDNIKKMLDEHIHETGHPGTGQSDNRMNHSLTKTPRKKRVIRGLSAAACVALCLVGGIAALQNSSIYNSKDAQYDGGCLPEQSAGEESDFAEETSDENAENKNVADGTGDLVAHSDLQSPSSYDAYYNTLKEAYDEYYDSIASVTTNEGIVYDEGGLVATEAASDALENDMFSEDAAMDVASNTDAEFNDSIDSAVDFAEESVSDSADSDDSRSKEFSSTNIQENTVDEGDIIKTDGTYIYKLINRFNHDTGYNDRILTITETDNGNLKALESIDLTALTKETDNLYIDYHEFYLYRDYLVLVYTKEDYGKNLSTTETNITLYDIRDKENPTEVQTFTQTGWYESSRINDGFLYTISNFNDASLETKKPYTNYIPSINGETIDCNNIYYPRNIFMDTTYVITSLDLNNPSDFTDTKAIPTNGGDLYVSDSSIYIYAPLYENVTKTEISKINYRNGILTPGKSATVAGYLYDSFALSEYNDFLRIVATIPANNISLYRFANDLAIESSDNIDFEDVIIEEDINVLYILDSNMELTGKLTGIAPGEQIYSARFMGDIGYFVTFENVDPLFSVDLSDPYNPEILGALKIPGFSNYLHAYEDDLLFGLGEEIDPNTSEFLGLKLSMFDVSDPADVTEQDKYIIENSTYSAAQYNHKAILIDPEKNIIGFAYNTINEQTYSTNYYYVTYTYDATEGFIETARYLVDDGSDYEDDAVRGIYIGDYFYLATNKTITSYEIGSNEQLAQITLK